MPRSKSDQYHKTMEQQVEQKLKSMTAFGQSKHAAMRTEDGIKGKIFSKSTYENYLKHGQAYARWLEQNGKCSTLKKGEKYVSEYLKAMEVKGHSAYTLNLEKSALVKLYQLDPKQVEYQAPTRSRYEIQRSRGEAVRDRHFSEKNNASLVQFCKDTGLRRSELEVLKGKDLLSRAEIEQRVMWGIFNPIPEREMRAYEDALKYFPDKQWFVHVESGKGGRERVSPILGQNTVERMQSTAADRLVFETVNKNADIHSYRADYANRVYNEYARPLKDIPYDGVNKGTGKAYQKDVYTCRNDEKGVKLDKKAMEITSKALGHNRIEVYATHYLRN